MYGLMRIGILVALAGLLQGCISFGQESPETAYYLLTAETEAQPAIAEDASATAISIGPVSIPEFLDRPQIVTRNGSRVRFADLHRWAEPLDTAVIRVVSENLARRYPQWQPVHHLAPQARRAERSLQIKVHRLDGTPGRAVIDITWQLNDNTAPERQVSGRFQTALVRSDDSYEQLIGLLSSGLAQFCQELPLP